MFVSCECCVLSGRGLCDGLIARPEECYWVWCVWVWSWILDKEEAVAHWELLCHGNKKSYLYCLHIALTLYLYTLNVLTPHNDVTHKRHVLAADGKNRVQLHKLSWRWPKCGSKHVCHIV